MSWLRQGRFGRIVGRLPEQQQRVKLTQTYKGCACVDTAERLAGTGHRFSSKCKAHGNPWFMVRTDPIVED